MKKRFLSFKYALRGIIISLVQPNMVIHFFAAVVTVLTGIFFDITKTEWIFIVMAIAMVVSAEIFNTSIEKLTDVVSPEKNEKAGDIKDLSAGAVLICSIAAAITGFIIFLPRLISFLSTC